MSHAAPEPRHISTAQQPQIAVPPTRQYVHRGHASSRGLNSNNESGMSITGLSIPRPLAYIVPLIIAIMFMFPAYIVRTTFCVPAVLWLCYVFDEEPRRWPTASAFASKWAVQLTAIYFAWLVVTTGVQCLKMGTGPFFRIFIFAEASLLCWLACAAHDNWEEAVLLAVALSVGMGVLCVLALVLYLQARSILIPTIQMAVLVFMACLLLDILVLNKGIQNTKTVR